MFLYTKILFYTLLTLTVWKQKLIYFKIIQNIDFLSIKSWKNKMKNYKIYLKDKTNNIMNIMFILIS